MKRHACHSHLWHRQSQPMATIGSNVQLLNIEHHLTIDVLYTLLLQDIKKNYFYAINITKFYFIRLFIQNFLNNRVKC